jgi:hypothetical protein
MAKKKQPPAGAGAESAVDLSPLLPQVQLHDLRLLNTSCSVPAAGPPKPTPELRQSITVNSSRTAQPPAIVVQISFSLIGTDAEKHEGLRVEATFGLMYLTRSADAIPPEVLAAFSQTVGVQNVWPYWREFVQSMTGRMGLPPLRMPLLNPAQLAFTPDQKQAGLDQSEKGRRQEKPRSIESPG